MRRSQQKISGLANWLALYGVELHGVAVHETQHGSGIVTTDTIHRNGKPFVQVPEALVLNLEYVWEQAEQDMQLKAVLEALGDFAKTPRGAILTFLLVQISATSPDMADRIGVNNPWTTYVQFLPSETSLPTFWSDEEQAFANGTTLAPALEAKVKSLKREFEHLKAATRDIAWCCNTWFHPRSGCLSLEDWKVVDAIWRSRAMELPSHGLCMVPVADMANHAHGTRVNSRTDVEARTHFVQLFLDSRNELTPGEEVTITYGEEKGACEMIFSYGFLDKYMERAESMFLDQKEPSDDPIFEAKKAAFDCAPGFRIMYKMSSSQVTWIGPFIWLMCINEEDGLELRIVDEPRGGRRLQASWKGKELKSVVDLDDALSSDENWDLFQLRAYSLVDERIREEMEAREKAHGDLGEDQSPQVQSSESNLARTICERLRGLEWKMLQTARDEFNLNIRHFMESRAVQRWFNEGSSTYEGDVDTSYSDWTLD